MWFKALWEMNWWWTKVGVAFGQRLQWLDEGGGNGYGENRAALNEYILEVAFEDLLMDQMLA